MKTVVLGTFLIFFCSLFNTGLSQPVQGQGSDNLLQQNRKPMRMSGSKFYIEDRLLSKTEALELLSISPDLIKSYEKGSSLKRTGTFLLVGGIVVISGGIPVAIWGGVTSPTYEFLGTTRIDYNGLYYAGLAIAAVGELMIDGAIVCKIVGKSQLRKTVANYNQILKQTGSRNGEFEYQLGLLDNGMFGLKLTF
ncbi:MAG: hypothetical protein JXR66_00985 [Bacteroidales bacterium]|nr:hypothetical protein [Bacteroidales bacterium]